MDTTMQAGEAAARSTLYWLLADLFLTCPDGAFVARLRHDLAGGPGTDSADPIIRQLTALRDALPADSPGTIALAVEYTRLFGSVRESYGPPPPYESVHRGSSLPTDVVVAVSAFYADAGLAPIDQAAPPDHLGVELRFLALLCHGESEAWRKGMSVDAIQSLKRQRDFLDRHLMQWAPDYLDVVQANTQHPFYRYLTALARRTMAEDKMVIEDRYAR
jgi:TorA maturation chaperone TorD